MKKLILCKGQIFGEEECLSEIFNISSNLLSYKYSITCESNDAEILYAKIEDI
jgi:hypothetical protein